MTTDEAVGAGFVGDRRLPSTPGMDIVQLEERLCEAAACPRRGMLGLTTPLMAHLDHSNRLPELYA
jgi:hypothetical protein